MKEPYALCDVRVFSHKHLKVREKRMIMHMRARQLLEVEHSSYTPLRFLCKLRDGDQWVKVANCCLHLEPSKMTVPATKHCVLASRFRFSGLIFGKSLVV